MVVAGGDCEGASFLFKDSGNLSIGHGKEIRVEKVAHLFTDSNKISEHFLWARCFSRHLEYSSE